MKHLFSELPLWLGWKVPAPDASWASIEQQLRQEKPSVSAPADLHSGIMARVASRQPARRVQNSPTPHFPALAYGIAAALCLITFAFWFATRPLAPSPESGRAMNDRNHLRGAEKLLVYTAIRPEILEAAAVDPLNAEFAMVQQDMRSTVEYLVSLTPGR